MKSVLLQMKNVKRENVARFAMPVVALALISTNAYANQLQPVEGTLQQLIDIFTGAIGTSLAVLAVIGCGLLAWGGRLTWGIALSIIAGIVLVFGSAQIVSFFQSAVGGGA